MRRAVADGAEVELLVLWGLKERCGAGDEPRRHLQETFIEAH